MKLDADIMRKIVLAVEGTNTWVSSVPGLSKEEFNYHAKHLIDNNFTEGQYAPVGMSQIPGFANIKDLKMEGHEFIKATKDENLWSKAKEHIVKPTASWTISLLIEYLKKEIGQRVGI
jgi:hypothetical protein